MNERIKELAAQAYATERLRHEPRWKPNKVSDVLLADFQEVFEIFAELIVDDAFDSAIRYGRFNDVKSIILSSKIVAKESMGLISYEEKI